MPKVKKIGMFAEQKEAVKRVINIGMARASVTGTELGEKKIINKSTLAKRKQNGGSTRLEELWRLDRILHFTDAEILEMFGRKI